MQPARAHRIASHPVHRSPRTANCITSSAAHRIANNPRTDNQPAAHRPQRTAHTSHLQLEGTPTHKEAANLQMNQSDMKEAVKTAILQHDHVLLNLTGIVLSMAKNHDSRCAERRGEKSKGGGDSGQGSGTCQVGHICLKGKGEGEITRSRSRLSLVCSFVKFIKLSLIKLSS